MNSCLNVTFNVTCCLWVVHYRSSISNLKDGESKHGWLTDEGHRGPNMPHERSPSVCLFIFASSTFTKASSDDFLPECLHSWPEFTGGCLRLHSERKNWNKTWRRKKTSYPERTLSVRGTFNSEIKIRGCLVSQDQRSEVKGERSLLLAKKQVKANTQTVKKLQLGINYTTVKILTDSDTRHTTDSWLVTPTEHTKLPLKHLQE